MSRYVSHLMAAHPGWQDTVISYLSLILLVVVRLVVARAVVSVGTCRCCVGGPAPCAPTRCVPGAHCKL